MTPEQFYAETLGKVIDYDGAYGAQCVDGFRYWGKMNSVPIPPTPNNWASGYWLSRDALGFSKWFVCVTDGNYRTGDWIIWNRGSKSHPSSHIAMWYYGQEYGENQGGTGGFCLKPTDFSDALGALRWKGYIMDDKTIEQLAYEVIAGMWGNGEERKERLTRAGYDYDAIQAKVDEIMAHNQVEDPEPEPEPTPAPEPNEPETPKEDTVKPILPDRIYDVLKWIGLVAFPALGWWFGQVGSSFGIENTDQIVTILNATGTLIGLLIGVSTIQYNRSKT